MKKFIALCGLAALLCARPALADALPVQNHSFENAGMASGGWSDCIDVSCGNPDPDWWINPDPSGLSNTNTAFAEVIDGFAADGTHHVGIDTDSIGLEVAQDLGFPLSPNVEYTLTVAVGNRNADFSPVGAMSRIALYVGNNATAGGTQLQYVDFPAGEFVGVSEFLDIPLTYTTGATVPDGNLWISLQNVGAVGRSHFDNVRLDAVIVPEPAGLLMLVLGVVALAARGRRH